MTDQGSESPGSRRDEPPRDPARIRWIRNYEAQRARWRSTRPAATIALVLAIAACFALQLLWGHGDSLARLRSMGSLVPESVFHGEIWRLLSAAFLHGGLQHAAFNGLALWILGGFVERILGARRLLVLVLGSAVAGNLASLLVHRTGQSVGASGGVWGLLAAGAVLGFRARGLLHPALVPGVRRAAGINLALNVVVSFLPQVNLFAHLGGGLFGAAILLSPSFTRGLPRFGPDDDPARPGREAGWIGPAAIALVATFAFGIGAAWLHGRPWGPFETVTWSEVEIPGLGVRATVPVSLGQEDEPDRDTIRFVRYGNLRRTPLAVRIGVAAASDAEDGGPGGVSSVETVLDEMASPLEGFDLDGPPERVDGPRGPIATVRWIRRSDGVRYELAAVAFAGRDGVVYAAYRESADAEFRGSALRVARSLEPSDDAGSRPPT